MTLERKPFLREASGLVKEMSSYKAFWFNVAALTGGVVPINYLYNAFYPAASFYGLGTLSLAQIFAAFAMIPLSLAYVGVLTAMPRTGGDYVFSSRILSPLLGWLETWMLLFTI